MVGEMTMKECFLIDLFNFPSEQEIMVVSCDPSVLERLKKITANFHNLNNRMKFVEKKDPAWTGRVIEYDKSTICW